MKGDVLELDAAFPFFQLFRDKIRLFLKSFRKGWYPLSSSGIIDIAFRTSSEQII